MASCELSLAYISASLSIFCNLYNGRLDTGRYDAKWCVNTVIESRGPAALDVLFIIK